MTYSEHEHEFTFAKHQKIATASISSCPCHCRLQCEASPLAVTLSRILVCKPHSADCERLISAYNRLKTDSRCRLDNETVKNYLYILLNMPPLANYDPRPAVTYWLQEKSRRHKATPRASQQQWLSNVFEAEQEVEAHKNGKQKLVRKF